MREPDRYTGRFVGEDFGEAFGRLRSSGAFFLRLTSDRDAIFEGFGTVRPDQTLVFSRQNLFGSARFDFNTCTSTGTWVSPFGAGSFSLVR